MSTIAAADRIMQNNRISPAGLRDALLSHNNLHVAKSQAAACLITRRANVNLAQEQGRIFRTTYWLNKAAFWRAHAFKLGAGVGQ